MGKAIKAAGYLIGGYFVVKLGIYLSKKIEKKLIDLINERTLKENEK